MIWCVLRCDFVPIKKQRGLWYQENGVNQHFATLRRYPLLVKNRRYCFGINYQLNLNKFGLIPKCLIGFQGSEIQDYATLHVEHQSTNVRTTRIDFQRSKLRPTMILGLDMRYRIVRTICFFVGLHVTKSTINSDYTLTTSDQQGNFAYNSSIQLNYNELMLSYGLAIEVR